ncbi:hypothetical protein [Winogradskya consettensis]|nr:hypothetical protein [Actinoplanes consettensis]
MDADDFYEEDENVEDLLAAFDQAEEGGKTCRPANGQTHWLTIFGLASRTTQETDQDTSNTLNVFAA